MPVDAAALERLALAAATLRGSSRAYTRKNLYHAYLRVSVEASEPGASLEAFDVFEKGPLAARLARGPLDGLLPAAARWDGPSLGREWEAYFPRSILVVDSRSVLDLFIACGVLTTARMAAVCIDGSPANVVEWLRRGFRAGHRAPIGYLHDAATAFYPFAIEPFASLLRAARDETIDYVDLGLPVRGAFARKFPLVREGWGGAPKKGMRVTELEALPPCAMVAYAARRLMARVPGDPQMAPLVREAKAEERAKRKAMKKESTQP